MDRPASTYERAAEDLALVGYIEADELLGVAGAFEVPGSEAPQYLEFGGVAVDLARWGLGLQRLFTGIRVMSARLHYPDLPHATVIALDNLESLSSWRGLAEDWTDPPDCLYEECATCDKRDALPDDVKCCSHAFHLTEANELTICDEFLRTVYPDRPDGWDSEWREDDDPLLAPPVLRRAKKPDGEEYEITIECRVVRDVEYLDAVIEQLSAPIWT